MKGERAAGALQYPAYLLVWSVGVLFFTGGFYRADAALVSALPIEFKPLASVPSLVTDAEFKVDLNAALNASEVVAGHWQPEREPVVEAQSQSPFDTKSHPVEVAEGSTPSQEARKNGTREAVILESVGSMESVDSTIVDSEDTAVPGAVLAESARAAGDRAVEPSDSKWSVSEASMEKRSVSNRVARVSEEVVALRREARKALSSGDSGRAFRVLMRNVRLAGNDKEYLALLAVAALEQRLPREALLVYEKLIKLDRLDSRWWMGLAVCQERLGADATAIYEEVVRLTEKGSDLQRLALDRLDTTPGVT